MLPFTLFKEVSISKFFQFLGRLIKVTDYQNRTVSYEYNSIGEKTKLIYPDGREAVYTYDEEGKLEGILGNGAKTGYTYDELGRLKEKLLPNGVKQAYSYLQGGSLESMISSDKDGILDKYFYSYNNSGLIDGIDRSRRGLDAVSGQYKYDYDAIGRLIQTAHNGVIKASYAYDAFGNRISLSDNEKDTSYTYDVLDRLVKTKELNSAQAIIKTYDYDRRGNQTKEYIDGLLQKTFTFDATNMLSKVVDKDKGELENHYNGLGFRVASIRPEEKIDYLCDLSRDYYNLLERTVNGETESFVYDDNVVSMSKEGNNYYYLQDELGSPMYMTGTDGRAVASYAFDDFGRNIDPFTGKQKKHAYATSGNIIQPFAFTGYQEDEVSGLKFAQARFYNAENGRFQSEDNIKGFIDSPFTLNHYGYCWGNPIVLIDLDGNMPDWLKGVYAHLAIEADIKQKYSNKNTKVHTNVFIKGGGKDRTKTGNGFADVVMKSGKKYTVYEIKPKTQDVTKYDNNGLIILTPGQEQLEGYVQGINDNIANGGSIGQYGKTKFGEKATTGTKKMKGVVTSKFLKGADITYYSKGDGMIYYEVGKTDAEKQHEIIAEKVKEKKDKIIRSFSSGVRSFDKGLAHAIKKGGAILQGGLEIIGGIGCIMLGGVLVADDVTVVGFLNNAFAIGAFYWGSALFLDGYRRIINAIFDCG